MSHLPSLPCLALAISFTPSSGFFSLLPTVISYSIYRIIDTFVSLNILPDESEVNSFGPRFQTRHSQIFLVVWSLGSELLLTSITMALLGNDFPRKFDLRAACAKPHSHSKTGSHAVLYNKFLRLSRGRHPGAPQPRLAAVNYSPAASTGLHHRVIWQVLDSSNVR